MTAAQACSLLVDTVRDLSTARAECESWRLLALAALRHVSELTRELDMVDQRSYINRTRAEDDRAVFLDQQDLRQQDLRREAA